MKPYSNPALDKKFDDIERNHVHDTVAAKATTKTALQDKTFEVAPGISPIWYDSLAKLTLPQPTWVVDKLVPDASITIISAPPAQYKTWLAFDIAINVASGTPVFGQFDTKQTKVLIIDEESGLVRARERLQALGIADDSQIAIASYNNFKINEASAKTLIAYCKAHAIGLVVFDSLTRIHNGDENLAKDMSVVMGDLKSLAQAGIAVVVIHHNRKPSKDQHGSSANEMRGSGDILAACDVQISVKRKPGSNIITVFQNKNRDAPDLPPFDLAIISNEDSVRFEFSGNVPKRVEKPDRTDEAIRALLSDSEPRFQAQIIAGLKDTDGIGGERMISERLKMLLDAGELVFSVGASGKHLYTLKPHETDD